MSGLVRRLFAPVDCASLVFFRVAFGAILIVEVYRYFTNGWIRRYYVEPDFYFKYYGFEWVQPWGGDGMYWHFAVLGVLAVMITVGLAYRFASAAFLAGFAYVFLLDQTRYLNHFYLVILVGALMCVLPANCAFSVDARLRPKLKSPTVPAWCVWVLVAQFEILYLYAGVVKVNADWLQLQPLTMWLERSGEGVPLLEDWLRERWVVAVGAWGVIALHIVGAPLLLWRKTRPTVFVIYVAFHLANHFLWRIGIFPWLAIAGTLMFFPPDWPRRFERWALRFAARVIERRTAAGQGTVSRLVVEPPAALESAPAAEPPATAARPLLVALLVAWLAFQTLVPLRHYAYPGDVAWTEEGHRFSWRMKLREKRGTTVFYVRDPATGNERRVDARRYLTRKQARRMACRPDMLLQFAHHLAATWRTERGIAAPEVRADTLCSLNGRPRTPLVDRTRDLAAVGRSLAAADWLEPLGEPLPPWPGGLSHMISESVAETDSR